MAQMILKRVSVPCTLLKYSLHMAPRLLSMWFLRQKDPTSSQAMQEGSCRLRYGILAYFFGFRYPILLPVSPKSLYFIPRSVTQRPSASRPRYGKNLQSKRAPVREHAALSSWMDPDPPLDGMVRGTQGTVSASLHEWAKAFLMVW